MSTESKIPKLAQALHTAARRYCDQQYRYWTEQYYELMRSGGDRAGPNYTPAALDIFPRYNVLSAIRVEIERFDPDELHGFDETLELMHLAVGTATDEFTRRPINSIAADAMQAERDSLCTYLDSLTHEKLRTVEPLPYRRVLREDETKSAWGRLAARWYIEPGYWYPLAESSIPSLLVFNACSFQESVGDGLIQQLLRDHSVSRIWEFREFGPGYLMDPDLLSPHYNGAEGYWSSEQMDWIIYASHESSVTVGGWVIEEIKRKWPEWKEHLWKATWL
ncbi:MAG: hypothetical protein ACFHWZ_15910 [Phycisphaerales bacterium]